MNVGRRFHALGDIVIEVALPDRKRFPHPIKVGPNTNRWLRSECAEALRAMAAERDKAVGGVK